jgi:hypothetical protein
LFDLTHLAVIEIKEEPKRHKAQGQPKVGMVIGVTETVPEGGEYRHDTAEAWNENELARQKQVAFCRFFLPFSSVIASARCRLLHIVQRVLCHVGASGV